MPARIWTGSAWEAATSGAGDPGLPHTHDGYEPSGTAAALDAAHVAAADPHPQYLDSAALAAHVDDDSDPHSAAGYIRANTTARLTGLVVKPSSGPQPAPGRLLTAAGSDGTALWSEPVSFIGAAVADKMLLCFFDRDLEGWGGAGTTHQEDPLSPTVPGCMSVTSEALWQGAAMPFDPDAVYRMTVRTKGSQPVTFGFLCTRADGSVVPASPTSDMHVLGNAVLPETDGYVSWAGSVSGAAVGAGGEDGSAGTPVYATGMPAPGGTSHTVAVAPAVRRWRPVIRSAGALIDSVEVDRYPRTLSLPGGLQASDVFASHVAADSVSTGELAVRDGGYQGAFLRSDQDGAAAWGPGQVALAPDAPTEPYSQASFDANSPVVLGSWTTRARGMIYSGTSGVTVTATAALTPMPTFPSYQFTLDTDAYVTVHMAITTLPAGTGTCYAYPMLKAEGTSTVLLADNWGGGAIGMSGNYIRAAGGGTASSQACFWGKLLPAGTYILQAGGHITTGYTGTFAYLMLMVEADPDCAVIA